MAPTFRAWLQSALTLLAMTFPRSCSSLPVSQRSGSGIQECRKTLAMPVLEVLPGGGWDNLRNLDMGRVMNVSYALCQTTEDGAYLIPDEVFVVPQKVSNVETHSELIESWLQQSSSVARSINADVSFLGVLNGKFSAESQRMKTHQVRESSVTTRVQVRNFMYSVKAHPGFSFDSRFRQQAGEIAEALENNQTRRAAFLAEMLVLQYGTHVLTAVDAGASLVQEDYLRSSFLSSSQSEGFSFSAAVGLNFFNKVNVGLHGGGKDTDSLTKAYQGNVTYSVTQSHGGAPFYPGITLQKWQESTANNLVAIDRSGLPLHSVLNPATLPDLPAPSVRKLARAVRDAVRRYYTVNTHPGCVKPDSPNFNFQANVDDDSCEGPATNLSFGGVYQRCAPLSPDAGPLCRVLEQKNPQTGSLGCQQPYSPTLLRSEVREESYSRLECRRECQRCWLILSCCKQVCGDTYRVRRAQIDTYWCATEGPAPPLSGFLFGGLYGPSQQNPFTNSQACPPGFLALTLLSDGLKICQSADYEVGARFAVDFGGLFSCEAGNPLAAGRPRCPAGFSQHVAAVSDGCQVLYCVRSGVFNGGELLPVRLPPFTRPPLAGLGATNTVAVMMEGERSWIRDGQSRLWKVASPGQLQKMAEVFDGSPRGLSGGETFGVVLGAAVALALAAGAVAYGLKRRRRWGRGSQRGYDQIPSEQAHGAAGPAEVAETEMEGGGSGSTQPLLA
ncbi:macrophage-expressed gene 1 protein [Lepisosteus oculatus]|uniref:macrophage-expressed gene 1 protein n=1 Tax=Lepisosteus oculatus TaxID=7918 RepID=UPI00371B68B2